MQVKKVEHFLDWRKATNQAGTHELNRLANSDRPVLDKTKYERSDIKGTVVTDEDIMHAVASIPK